MAIYRLQVAFARDTTLPADQLIITPHFVINGVLVDPDQLCEDLATALDAWDSGTGQLNVKAYDAQGTPPVYPVGDATRNVGAAPLSSGVREAAVCLSFYADQNRPRKRGRLYIPATLLGNVTAAARPSGPARQLVADLVPIFANLGGANVDWVVFSRADNTARKVTNWWVDDAWDIQRSRGLRTTARLEGTTSG